MNIKNVEYIEIDLEEILDEIDYHLFRANWSKEKAKSYLIFQYHKNSRLKLTDDELLEFLAMVRQLPSKYFLSFRTLTFPEFPSQKNEQILF